MTILTSPFASIYVEIEAVLRRGLSVVKTQQWFLSARDEFGGQSAIQMIKAGRGDEVMREATRVVDDGTEGYGIRRCQEGGAMKSGGTRAGSATHTDGNSSET